VQANGAAEIVVVLGTPDRDSTEIVTQTVTTGDPSYAGPLAGISLGLPVIHVLDERVAAQSDPETYSSVIGVMLDALDTEAIVAATVIS
jgi:glycine reductase|tara:strand:+ start:462 stop:728 length:267 start_codon:yes stop_codon:yes gene_type:complete